MLDYKIVSMTNKCSTITLDVGILMGEDKTCKPFAGTGSGVAGCLAIGIVFRFDGDTFLGCTALTGLGCTPGTLGGATRVLTGWAMGLKQWV